LKWRYGVRSPLTDHILKRTTILVVQPTNTEL